MVDASIIGKLKFADVIDHTEPEFYAGVVKGNKGRTLAMKSYVDRGREDVYMMMYSVPVFVVSSS